MSTSPYDPPRAVIPIPTTASRWPRVVRHPTARSLALFGVSVLITMFGMQTVDERSLGHGGALAHDIITVGLAVATLLAFVGVVSGLHGAVVLMRSTAEQKILLALGSLAASGMNGVLTLFTFTMTLWSTNDFRRGRQLRSFGRVLLPPLQSGRAWAELSFLGLPEEARVTAAQWRENGRTEHASVAAFAVLTTELMALGAPPELLAATQRDALDEIRHTELCFSLARAFDGHDVTPGPFPQARRSRPLDLGRSFALARLAADSLVDGALHEGVSARVLAKLARRCEVAAVDAMLREIARDEGRHAAHGWDVVLWCVNEGGEPVVAALETALAALPETMLSKLPTEAASGAWERFGIHGHTLEEAEYQSARRDLAQRVATLRCGLAAKQAA